MPRRVRLKCLRPEQVHAIRRPRPRYHNQPRHLVRRRHLGPFARHKVIRFMRGLQNRHVIRNLLMRPEDRRNLPQPLLPRCLVQCQRRLRSHNLRLRLFSRKIRRLVLFLRPNLLLRLHLLQRIQRLAVPSVRRIPKRPLDGRLVIRQRQRQRRQRTRSVRPMRVIQRRRPQPHLHIRRSRVTARRLRDCPKLRGNIDRLGIRHGITQEIWLERLRPTRTLATIPTSTRAHRPHRCTRTRARHRRNRGSERTHCPVQLTLHRIDQHQIPSSATPGC